MRKPCKECPFSRAIEPGGTGGSSPAIYIGQAYGPFFLPCHMDSEYTRDKRSVDLLQCVGAATFRANVGVDVKMPEALLHCPPDTNLVFADAAELLAHHGKVSREEASAFLAVYPPARLLRIELSKKEVEEVKVTRKNR